MIGEQRIRTIGKYEMLNEIGRGTFSVVFSARQSDRPEQLSAIKRIETKSPEQSNAVSKELLIHRCLKHQNIIRLLDAFKTEKYFYLVQELAEGGEMFELIEPDRGFPEKVAHVYFKQLIFSLKYLKDHGVCHRDLKPENLLLDAHGNLKISDFGLATVFKKDGKRRTLFTRCGTAIYMAPEVASISEGYQGDDCDLWSCAIVLYVMIVGNVPWEEATMKNQEFSRYMKTGKFDSAADSKLPTQVKNLLSQILLKEPKARIKIEQVMQHPWFIQNNSFIDLNGMVADSKALFHAIQSRKQISQNSPENFVALTQPESFSSFYVAGRTTAISSSQPSRDQIARSKENYFYRSHLTRFYCNLSKAIALEEFKKFLSKILVSFTVSESLDRIRFATVDRRRNPLSGELTIQNISEQQVLVIMCKHKGDPLEFGKLFRIINDNFM